MKITAIIIVALILAAAAIVFAWSRSKQQETGSFWDVIRNPDSMPDLDKFHEMVDNAATTLSGSSTEIEELVDYFVFEAKSARDGWTELRILAKLESEAYPRALEILRDPSLKDRLTVLTYHDKSSLPEAPINRLCEIFDQEAAPPEEAALLLAPFLRSDNNEIRKSVALTIGSIASRDSLPDLRRALTDADEYVRSFALMGSPVKVCKTLKSLVFRILSKGVKDTQHVGVLKIPESERGDKDVTQRSVSEVC